MFDYKFTPDVNRIFIPRSYRIQTWEEFLVKLMELDHMAPFHAILARYRIVADDDFTLPPSMYGKLYYNLGIEMAAVDRYPAEIAAENVGFLQKGIRMVAAAVVADNGQDSNLLTAARVVFSSSCNWEELPKNIIPLLKEALQPHGSGY